MVIRWLVVAVGAYMLGSVPTGIFWAWVAQRIDVRQVGSGRTGGTNVWRSVGFLPALMTAIFDALKGAAAVWLATALGLPPWGRALAGTLAVVGHNYSLFLGFRGGAGTATSWGVAGFFWPATIPMIMAAGIAAALLVGHASVASILVALMLPLLFVVRNQPFYALGFGVPVMLLTLWALRPNIERLLHGRERFLPIFRNKPPLIRLSHHPATDGTTAD